MVATSLVVLIANANDFDLAQKYVANLATQLRSPDALYLEVAHNNRMEFTATLDGGMLSAGKKLKIPARRVIRQILELPSSGRAGLFTAPLFSKGDLSAQLAIVSRTSQKKAQTNSKSAV